MTEGFVKTLLLTSKKPEETSSNTSNISLGDVRSVTRGFFRFFRVPFHTTLKVVDEMLIERSKVSDVVLTKRNVRSKPHKVNKSSANNPITYTPNRTSFLKM